MANTVRAVTMVQLAPVARTGVQSLEVTAVFAASSRFPVRVTIDAVAQGRSVRRARVGDDDGAGHDPSHVGGIRRAVAW